MAQRNSRTLWTQITSTDLLAKSVFYQLFLFVIVTGVLRNYLQWTKANLLLKPIQKCSKERFISVFENQMLLLFDILGLDRLQSYWKAKHLRRVLFYSQISLTLICVHIAWLVYVCENHSWLMQSIIYGRWESDVCFDPISRANFETRYTKNILLAAFEDFLFPHKFTNHVCPLVAFHSSQTRFALIACQAYTLCRLWIMHT